MSARRHWYFQILVRNVVIKVGTGTTCRAAVAQADQVHGSQSTVGGLRPTEEGEERGTVTRRSQR